MLCLEKPISIWHWSKVEPRAYQRLYRKSHHGPDGIHHPKLSGETCGSFFTEALQSLFWHI